MSEWRLGVVIVDNWQVTGHPLDWSVLACACMHLCRVVYDDFLVGRLWRGCPSTSCVSVGQALAGCFVECVDLVGIVYVCVCAGAPIAAVHVGVCWFCTLSGLRGGPRMR